MEESLDYLPNHPEIKLFQDHSMICINTDTMVLGEFLEVYRHDTVLDIGTNNGSLLLYANRWNAKKLIGVDINSRALELAKKNLELNGIMNYELINADAKTLRIDPVDVVICNPPYFKNTLDSKNSNQDIALAKHDDSLPLDALIKSIVNNLKDNGKLFFVYQSSRLQEVIDSFSKYHLNIKVMQFVYNVNKDNSNITLFKAVKGGKSGMEVKKPLMISNMQIL